MEFPRHAYGPILVFTGGSVEWQSSFTRGRTVVELAMLRRGWRHGQPKFSSCYPDSRKVWTP